VAFIHELADALKAPPHRHEVKYALMDSDPQLAEKPFAERAKLCYLWDREMVEKADIVIAEASFPSTGLGIEMQLAEAKGIPIVLCYRDFGQRSPTIQYENPDHSTHELQVGEGFVTLMAMGMPTVFRVLQYNDRSDGLKSILEAVEILQKD
jgi:nucleoside 2-deoxyribosyltransferase